MTQARMRDRRSHSGFTLMEILVAIFILAVGLVAVMSVFPLGIKMGTEAVKDSYSGIIARSVFDAFKVCLRENRFSDPKSGHPYIVFDHDGILDDPASHNPKNPDYEKDFIILLPQYFKDDTSKKFIYPETSTTPNGNGSNAAAEDDGERMVRDRYDTEKEEITKTYQLGQFIKARMADPETPEFEKQMLAQDPYPQYSFALILQRAQTDSNGDGVIDRKDKYSNSLFVVTVNIYRKFDPDPKLRWNEAIHSMTMQVEM